MEALGPDACQSDLRGSGQLEHRDFWITLGQSVRVSGLQVWPQSATKAVSLPHTQPGRWLQQWYCVGAVTAPSSFELFVVLLRPQFPHLGSAGLPVTSFPPGQEDEVGRFANP